MAITQERMLALITEAEGFRDTYKGLRKHIKEIIAQERREPGDLNTFLMILEHLVDSTPLPIENAILLERYHFRKFSRKNKREKERAAARRINQGAMPQAIAKRHRPSYEAPQLQDRTAVQDFTFGEAPEAEAEAELGIPLQPVAVTDRQEPKALPSVVEPPEPEPQEPVLSLSDIEDMLTKAGHLAKPSEGQGQP